MATGVLDDRDSLLFPSVSCPGPPHLTTVDHLSYHMKPTDATGATLSRVTGGSRPQT